MASAIRMNSLQRLGKNLNGYFGETLDIQAVLADCVTAGRQHGWSMEEIPAPPKSSLLALTRTGTPNSAQAKRVYISAGIHGDEPAGPLAIRQLLQENQWPSHVSLFVLPCLNPTGFPLNRRENSEGIDLNRQYLETKAEETLAHIRWLKAQPEFDLCLVLHEDWEAHGFYLYELNPGDVPSLAPAMMNAVTEVCPIDPSDFIEGRPAQSGIIRPSVDPRTRPLWPESFYLLTHKTRLSYTLEAPSDYPLSARVGALVTAVRAALMAV